MFSFLKFKMPNSLGIPVLVSIAHISGLLSYEIDFMTDEKSKDKKKSKRNTMSKGNSDKFIKKWEKISCNDMFKELGVLSNFNDGDYWSLEIGYDNMKVSMSGSKTKEGALTPFIQPLIELFDNTFGITQFVMPTRIDRLEIEMFEPVLIPQELAFLGERNRFGHEEYIGIDRETLTLCYSRRVPERCFHNRYECYCESEVRDILDWSSEIFEELSLSKDCVYKDKPLVTFTFYFHDGSQTKVHKTLTKTGIGSVVYDEMLNIVGQTIGKTVFGGGLFIPN